MREIPRWTVALVLTALLAGASLASAQPKPCDIDAVPAATLLLPYFVATGQPGPPSSTLLAVVNTSAATRIAHFTLWTNWAIPTASFDVVLTPADVFTEDLNRMFIEGPNLGDEFSTCREATGLLPGTLHLNPEIGTAATLEEKLALLRTAHRGEVLPNGMVAGAPDDFMVGYVTIDVVNKCTKLFPSSPGYFKKGGTGIASDVNALVGDWLWVDYSKDAVAGDVMVHIRAHKTAFKSGNYTFYGRYVNKQATDDRQPLGQVFGSRYVQGFVGITPVNTYLVVWRDTKSPNPSPVPAGTEPLWVPLPVRSFVYWDEEENPVSGGLAAGDLGLAAQAFDISSAGLAFPFGWMKMDLGHRRTSLFKTSAQAWVTPLFESAPNPSVITSAAVSLRAYLLPSTPVLCKP